MAYYRKTQRAYSRTIENFGRYAYEEFIYSPSSERLAEEYKIIEDYASKQQTTGRIFGRREDDK
jgi:hypothetical protein